MPNKRRLLFMCGTCLCLFVVSAGFAAVALTSIGTPLARFVMIGVIALVSVCFALTVVVMRAGLRLPGRIPPRTLTERAMSRRFGLVFAAEGVGCAALSWLCVITHHVAFIAAANIAIVGLHFLPLARIVSVPRYYVTGALMFAVSAITVIGIPTALRLGQGLAIYSVPSLACSPILIGTALLGVREAWMGISASAAPV